MSRSSLYSGIRLKASLGQHFLAEPNTVRRIVEIAGVSAEDCVLEIGAGAGTLTRALADRGARVIAYEVDEGLRPVLAEVVGDTAEIRFEDASNIDFGVALPPGEWALVANLPYNVGTPILLRMLREVPRVTRFVVMLQREAIERLAAEPGSKTYGIPSVVVALHGRIEVALRVPPHLFVPRPKVESAVAVIDRIEANPAADRAVEIASGAFGQRRKMVRASLRGVLDDPPGALMRAGIDPTARAEELSPADYLRLATA